VVEPSEVACVLDGAGHMPAMRGLAVSTFGLDETVAYQSTEWVAPAPCALDGHQDPHLRGRARRSGRHRRIAAAPAYLGRRRLTSRAACLAIRFVSVRMSRDDPRHHTEPIDPLSTPAMLKGWVQLRAA
jgi:hypothetical protein